MWSIFRDPFIRITEDSLLDFVEGTPRQILFRKLAVHEFQLLVQGQVDGLCIVH